jgi:hypothetical protein
MARFPYRIVVDYEPTGRRYTARVPSLRVTATGSSPTRAVRAAQAAAAQGAARRDQLEGGPPAPGGDSGKFLLRVGAALHRRLAQLAAADGLSLNQETLLVIAAGVIALDPARPAPDVARTRAQRRLARDGVEITARARPARSKSPRARARTKGRR